jgi:hypothetical protein
MIRAIKLRRDFLVSCLLGVALVQMASGTMPTGHAAVRVASGSTLTLPNHTTHQ